MDGLRFGVEYTTARFVKSVEVVLVEISLVEKNFAMAWCNFGRPLWISISGASFSLVGLARSET